MSRKQDIPLIAIAGGSGSGKSWLARKLSDADVTTICIDRFYLDRPHLSSTRRAACNYDHPRAIDWNLLRQTLEHARRGTRVEIPVYSFEQHLRTGVARETPGRMIILEGLWALRNRAIAPLIDLGIFVDADSKLRLERRLTRDVKERGRSRSSVLRQFREQVEPMHKRFVEPQRRRADLILQSPISSPDLKLLRCRIAELRTGDP